MRANKQLARLTVVVPPAPTTVQILDELTYYGQQVIEIDKDNFVDYLGIAGSNMERIAILKGMLMQVDAILSTGVVVCPCCNHEFVPTK